MTIDSAIATNVPLSGDVEISASTSVLVVALCWTCFFTEGHDVGILGAILPALATDASWKLTPIELGTVSASLILTGYLASLVRSAETGFTLSLARIGALLRPCSDAILRVSRSTQSGIFMCSPKPQSRPR